MHLKTLLFVVVTWVPFGSMQEEKAMYELRTFPAGSGNWHTAKAGCESAGKKFAVVTTRLQKCLLEDTTPLQHTWIGLSDDVREGHFVWTDGSSFNSRHWSWYNGKGPNGGRWANCIIVYKWSLYNKLDDYSCSAKKIYYVCQNSYNPADFPYDPVCEHGEGETDVCKYCLVGHQSSKTSPLPLYPDGSENKPYKLDSSMPTCATVRSMRSGATELYVAKDNDDIWQSLCGSRDSKMIFGRLTTGGQIKETTIETHDLNNGISTVWLNLYCNGGSLSAELFYRSPGSDTANKTMIDGDIFTIECACGTVWHC